MAKRKILMYSLFGLVAVSLTSVAFANWIISGTQNVTSPDITVNVGAVEDHRMSATASVTEGAICFDAVKTDTTGPIKYGGSTSGEDLSFTISVTVTNSCKTDGTAASYFGGINLKWTLLSNDAATTALSSAITNNYITSPLSTNDVTLRAKAASVPNKNISATWTNNKTTSLTAEITFSFAWNTTTSNYGVENDGDNPSLVSETASSTQVNNCVTMLNALYSANGAKFTVTATPVSI